MYEARKSKVKIEQKSNNGVGSGKVWKNKLTVPRAPNLTIEQRKVPEINSLRRPATPQSLQRKPKVLHH
jgi:hypothetical protein